MERSYTDLAWLEKETELKLEILEPGLRNRQQILLGRVGTRHQHDCEDRYCTRPTGHGSECRGRLPALDSPVSIHGESTKFLLVTRPPVHAHGLCGLVLIEPEHDTRIA